MANNRGVAYDLSLYEQRAAREDLKVIKPQVKKKKSVSKGLVALSAVLFLTVSFLVYSKVSVAETSYGVASAQRTYEELKGEETQLQMKLESRMSLGKVEQIAKEELGLVKLQNYQIKYFSVEEQNRIEFFKPEQQSGIAGFFSRIWAGITGVF